MIPNANLLDISFAAGDTPVIGITKSYVDELLGELIVEKDLSHFIL